MALKASQKRTPKIKAFSVNENQCIWMKAGIVNFKLCENAYDCLSCRFDKVMTHTVEKRPEQTETWGRALAGKPYPQKECRHMLTGRVHYHFCSNSYQCHVCEFDQTMEETDLSAVRGSVPMHRIAGFHVADSYYYHRGHSWARVEHGGLVRLGMDDFALRLIGHPTGIQLPKLASRIEQTEAGWTITRDKMKAQLLSPISGVVLATNNEVLKHPDSAKQDPYLNGWLLVVEPDNLRQNLKNLLFEEEAEAWIKTESQRLETLLASAYGLPLAATGGEIVDDIYGNVASKMGWDELVHEFLLT